MHRLLSPKRLPLCAGLLGAAFVVTPLAASAAGKIGIIGDSMAAGTHSLDSCGSLDIVECVEERGGYQDRAWSYARGEHAWPLAARLGFTPAQVVDAADDGEEWRGMERCLRPGRAGAVRSRARHRDDRARRQ